MMRQNHLIERMVLGATAGLAGTGVLQQLRTQAQRMLPETAPPMHEEPGPFMVAQAEEWLPDKTSVAIPASLETAAASSLALGYGMTAGAIYAALCPDGSTVIVEGVVLGLGTWAVGYLGWLPALKLMPPVQRQAPPQVIGPIAQHLVFGLVTAAAYHGLRQAVD